MESKSSEQGPFLITKVSDHDTVLLEVKSEPQPQSLRAKLLRVYSGILASPQIQPALPHALYKIPNVHMLVPFPSQSWKPIYST